MFNHAWKFIVITGPDRVEGSGNSFLLFSFFFCPFTSISIDKWTNFLWTKKNYSAEKEQRQQRETTRGKKKRRKIYGGLNEIFAAQLSEKKSFSHKLFCHLDLDSTWSRHFTLPHTNFDIATNQWHFKSHSLMLASIKYI